jgi:hypothetical protein
VCCASSPTATAATAASSSPAPPPHALLDAGEPAEATRHTTWAISCLSRPARPGWAWSWPACTTTPGGGPIAPPAGRLVARDKASLDLFWLSDESLEDTDNLLLPGVIAAEIVEDLQAALAEFTELAESLQAIGVETMSED